MTEGIQAIFPLSTHQTCIVHQIRNASKYVSWKDRKAFARDMKPIYQAINEEQAKHEGGRCMSCGVCFECDQCVVYCPQDAIFRVKKDQRT